MRPLLLCVVLSVAAAGCGKPAAIAFVDADGAQQSSLAVALGPIAPGQSDTRSVTVVNTGDARLTLTGFEFIRGASVDFGMSDSSSPAPFGLVLGADALEPGGSTGLTITFRPQRADGSTTVHSELALVAKDGSGKELRAPLQLSGISVLPPCDFAPFDFGSVKLGATVARTLTLANPSTQTRHVEVVTPLADMSPFKLRTADGKSSEAVDLAPGAEASVEVTFTPDQLTESTAVLHIEPGETCPTRDVQLHGTGLDHVLLVPEAVDCRFAAPGTTAHATLSVSNLLTTPVTLSNLSTTDPRIQIVSDARVVPPISGAIPDLRPGRLELDVACTPDAIGPISAVLGLHSDAPGDEDLAVPATVFGGAPDIDVTPTGVLELGTVSFVQQVADALPRSLTIRNVGTPDSPGGIANLILGPPATTEGPPMLPFQVVPLDADTSPGDFYVDFAAVYEEDVWNGIPAGGEVTIHVTLTPSTPGAKHAALKIFSNDPDEPEVDVELHGTAVELPPCTATLTPNDAVLSFGLIPSYGSRELELRLHNDATAPGADCIVRDVQVTTYNGFEVDGPSAPVLLAPGDSLPLHVRATNAGISTGPLSTRTGWLYLTLSSPAEMQIPLSAQLGSAVLEMMPGALDFGAARVGCSSKSRIVSLYAPLNSFVLQSMALVQPVVPPGTPGCPGTVGCEEFTLDSKPAIPANGLTLSPGSPGLTAQVSYTPVDSGKDLAALEIGGTQSAQSVLYLVPLSGEENGTGEQLDTFSAPPLLKDDVLFVIDDGADMAQFTALAAQFAQSAADMQAAQTDFRIGVTSCNLAQGTIGAFRTTSANPLAWLTPSTPNLVNELTARMPPPNQTGAQDCMRAAADALFSPSGNAFLRADAQLDIVIVTASNPANASVTYAVNALWNVKGFDRKSTYRVSAVGPTGASWFSGTGIENLVTQGSGVFADLSVNGWSHDLDPLWHTTMPATFFLSAPGDFSTTPLSVEVNGAAVPSTSSNGDTVWTFDTVSESVTFAPLYAPQPGDTVGLRYVRQCF